MKKQDNENSTSKQFAKFLKQKRIALGLTLKQLAKDIYNDERRRGYISDIENGKRIAKTETMDLFFNYFNCRITIEEF